MSRAVVVGAGIVGAAVARALAAEGLDVVIADHRSIGSGATAAGMGHLVALDDSDAQFALCRRSQTLWDDLVARAEGRVECTRSGTLWVAADEDEQAEVGRKARYFADRGVAAEILDACQMAEAEPHLRPGLAGGLRVPGDSVVYPPTAARFLLDEAVALGATLEIGPKVIRITGHEVGRDDGSTLAADLVVNAAGLQAVALTPGLPIRARKGHLVITDRHPGFARHQLLELGYLKSAHGSDHDSVAFNVQPRPTGQLLIGSSRQFGTDDPGIDPAMLRKMVDRAILYMPELAKLSAIRAWAGFRAATPDSLPLVGPHPDEPGLWIAAGHEGLGITTSLATAELIAAGVTGRAPAIPPKPYLPSRGWVAA